MTLDLSPQVTVFVTTIGAPTFELCVQHLREQDCNFQLEIIENIAPMNVAFQRMLDDCRTPFFVQVDEDMLLHPEAIRTLHERIAAAPPEVAMYVATLYDQHLERCIIGVKIFRHEVARRYPFRTDDSFEVEQLQRMAVDGYRYERAAASIEPIAGETLGLHGVQWTAPLIYERYQKLMRRTLDQPISMRWFKEVPKQLLERFIEQPNEENFFALQGTILGVLLARGGPAPAKDFREYGATPEYALLEQIFRRLGVMDQIRTADDADDADER